MFRIPQRLSIPAEVGKWIESTPDMEAPLRKLNLWPSQIETDHFPDMQIHALTCMYLGWKACKEGPQSLLGTNPTYPVTYTVEGEK